MAALCLALVNPFSVPQNLCALAYNELERRVYSIVEQVENEGFENYATKKHMQIGRIVDYMNAIKLLNTVNDERLTSLLLEKVS